MTGPDPTASQYARACALACAVNLEHCLPHEVSAPPYPQQDPSRGDSLAAYRAAQLAAIGQMNEQLPMIEQRATDRALRNAVLFAGWIETGEQPGGLDDEIARLGGPDAYPS
jgi:hypothetical protein